MQKTRQEIFYKKLGENIRASRGKIKQDSLAQVLNLKRISISNIENGKQKIQIHTLMELANYLRVDVSDLIPPMQELSPTITQKLEKSIAKGDVSKKETVEKLKDFVKISASAK